MIFEIPMLLKTVEDDINLFRAIIDKSSSSVVVTDPDSCIVYVNESFTSYTGYKMDEVLGKNPRILKSGLTPEKTYKEMWDTLTNGKEWSGQFLNKHKDGTLFWEDATIFPLKNEAGAIKYFIGIKRNINQTERS